MGFTSVQPKMLTKLSLAFLLSVSVSGEKSQNAVCTSVVKFLMVFNLTHCNESRISDDSRSTGEWCCKLNFNPEAGRHNLKHGICQTKNYKPRREKCFHGDLVKTVFIDCEVSCVTNITTNSSWVILSASCFQKSNQSNSSTDIYLCPRFSCTQSRSQNRKKNCLVLSSRERTKQCFGRTFSNTTQQNCTVTSRPNSTSPTTRSPSQAENNVSKLQSIINFVKKRAVIFSAVGGGILVMLVVIVAVCLCRRKANRRGSTNLEMETLPTPSSPLYSEVDIYTYPQFGNGQAPEQDGREYDYAYAHTGRRKNYGDPSYVNVQRAKDSDHDQSHPLGEDIANRETKKSSSLMRTEAEKEGVYEPLSGSGSPQDEVDEKNSEPLKYVNVL